MKPPLDHPEIRDHRFQRHMAQVHAMGPRVLAEAFFEVGARTGHMTTIEQVIARYAALDPDKVRALNGDRFAPRPTLRVIGGRRHG